MKKTLLIVIFFSITLTASFTAAGEENKYYSPVFQTSTNTGSFVNFQEKNPFFFKFNRFKTHFLWGEDFIPTGAEFTIGYKGFQLFRGVDTIYQVGIGAGYEGFETYRAVDYTPNSEIDYSAGHNKNIEFNSPNFQWDIGVRQGILYNNDLGHNLIEAFLFYRGRMDFYLKGRHFWGTSESRIKEIEDGHKAWQEQYTGTDAYGIFGNSFMTGIAYNDLSYDRKTKAFDGLFMEASIEISPYLPSVMGATDFYRANFSGKYFKTLFQARPSSKKNVFTVYLGDYFSIDYADAKTYMPLYVMQTFGGTDLRYGLAESVRGFERFSWDTQLKIVNNIELRFNLPVLYRMPKTDYMDIVPGFLTYFDIGYGRGYWGDTSGAEGGILASTGIGAYLNLFDNTYLRLYSHFPLIGKRLDGAPMKLNFDINLHF